MARAAQIIRNFNLYNEKTQTKYSVILTKHLFEVRDGQHGRRIYMFDSIGQISHLLKYALNNYDLSKYINKGKVSIRFTYQNEVFGLLLVLEQTEDSICDITIITVDKIDVRHYTTYKLFHNVLHDIHSEEYVLNRSHLSRSSNLNTLETLKQYNCTYKIVCYDAIMDKINMDITYIRNWQSVIALLTDTPEYKDGLLSNTGAFWFDFTLFNRGQRYFKVSIVEYLPNEFYFIILNLVNKERFNNLREFFSDALPYYNNLSSIDIGAKPIIPKNPNPRKRLTIKKKKEI